MDTIGVPGSSANAIKVDGSTLYVVTGYAGGAYSMPRNFNDDTKFDAEDENNRINVIAPTGLNTPTSANFGGKYIAGDYILRTDDQNAYLLSLDGQTEKNIGAPLTSEQKYAEAYDPAKGEWYPLSGEQAAHYGKHTMAVDGRYVYVAGGKGHNGVNGLRVYSTAATSGSDPIWQNGNNTTAVCVEGDYVYAATGAGLRVYEKYDPAKGQVLPLYAYEVLDYDENGNAADHEGSNQPQAGTDAHSSNFVAVDPATGLIFVACGQSGVYVFKLNHEAAPTTVNVKIKGQSGEDVLWTKEKDLEPGSEDQIKVPTNIDLEIPEGKELEGWTLDPNDPDSPIYKPGDEFPITAGEEDSEIILYPVFKDKETPVQTYTVKFDLNGGNGTAPTDMTASADDSNITVPTQGDITRDGYIFQGWAETATPDADTKIYKADGENPTYTVTGDVTLYAVWGKSGSGGSTPGTGSGQL